MVSSHILSKFKCIYVQFMQLDIYIYILYLSPPEQLENGFDFFLCVLKRKRRLILFSFEDFFFESSG
jgi:hypothetical protein